MLADRNFRPFVDPVGSHPAQPFEDDEMSGSNIACARCGLMAPPEELRLWEQRERYRIFQGPAAARTDASEAVDPGTGEPVNASGGVYRYVHKHCAYLTCQACYAKLSRGSALDDLHLRKVLVYIAILVVIGIALIAVAPSAMPTLLSTFWRTR